jgi:hypothetical protein
MVLVTGLAGPAYAALPQTGSGTTGNGGGVAYQNMNWNFTNRSVLITSRTAGGMNWDRCMDASFDWRTSGDNHYDARPRKELPAR